MVAALLILLQLVAAIVASLGSSQRKAIRWIEPCSSSVDIWRKVPSFCNRKENGEHYELLYYTTKLFH